LKADEECFTCLEGLAIQAIELATADARLRAKARDKAFAILKRDFSTQAVPTLISDRMHAAIKEITGNPDPYLERKKVEIDVAKELSEELGSHYGHDLRSCVGFSAIGNTLDFFRGFEEVKRDARRRPRFAIDDVNELKSALERAERVLYLADNAGECFFDLPLFKKFQEFVDVAYVVKGGPIQNDLTLEDLERAGIAEEFGRIITIGAATVGIDFRRASTDFKREFEQADLILSKGMGNYETLSELPARGRIFYLLMAKCAPVAKSLGVPPNSYVAMLR
jgi:hypothetical protein